MYGFIYVRDLAKAHGTETGSAMVVATDWGRGMGSWCLVGVEWQLRKMKRFCGWTVMHNISRPDLKPLNHRLKMIKMEKLILYIHYP